VKEVAPNVYVTSGGGFFSTTPKQKEDLKAEYLKQYPEMQTKPGIYRGGALIVSPGKASEYTAGQLFRDVRQGTATVEYETAQKWADNRRVALEQQAKNQPRKTIEGQYVVRNPYTQQDVDLSTAKNAAEAMRMAGYRPPEAIGQLNLVRQKSAFTVKGEGVLPAWYFRGKGTEPKGTITVYKQTITAQNQAEARLAGLPEPGEYELLRDVRNYKPREGVITVLNKKATARIDSTSTNRKTSLGGVSRDVAAFGARIRTTSRQTADNIGMPDGPPKDLGERFTKGGQAFAYSFSKLGEYGGGGLQAIGTDIRERPIQLAAAASAGAIVRKADGALLALRSSKLLAGSGKVATTARGAITGARIGAGSIMAGGYAASIGTEVLQTRGDAGKLGELAGSTALDLTAFRAGARLASPVKVPQTSGPKGDVRVRSRSTQKFETTDPRMESPAAPRTTVTTSYAETLAGSNKPLKTRVMQYPSGTLSKVQTAEAMRIVTTQRLGQQYATAKVYEQGQLSKVVRVKAEATGARASTTTLTNNVRSANKQVSTNIIAQASVAQRTALVQTSIGGKAYTGLSMEQGASRALSIAGDARIKPFGRVVQNRGKGGKIIRSQTGKTTRAKTPLQLGEDATIARNEYAMSRGQFVKDMAVTQTSEPTLLLGSRSVKVQRTVAGITAKRSVASVVQSESISEVTLSRTPKPPVVAAARAGAKKVTPILRQELRAAAKPATKTYAAGRRAGKLISETENKAITALRIRKVSRATTETPSPVLLEVTGQKAKAVPISVSTAQERTTYGKDLLILPNTETLPAPKDTVTAPRLDPISRMREELGITTEAAPLSASRLSQGNRSKTRSELSQRAEQGVRTSPIEATLPRQERAPVTVTRPATTPRVARLPTLDPRLKYGRSIVKTPQPKLPPFKPRSSLSGGSGFTVLVRRRGKFKKLNPDPLPLDKAITVGKQKVKSTLAASVRIVDQSGKSADARTTLAGLGRAFRPAKKDSTTFVQKAPFRLSSRGERQDIQAARKNRKGGLFG
jgi:hypothetical protein